ncbi:MAG: XRE family transcriptional regulator, partial [Kurthia sp.]
HYRGLKPKRSGDGRRGGYDAKQKAQVIQSLANIQSIKMNLTKLQSFEKGKPKNIKLEGRTFLFIDEDGQDMIFDLETMPKNIYFTIDTAFASYLSGAGRQVALQHKKALHYHPTQQLYEKRLCRYLSWRWRIQARKGNYLIPNTISTMLDSIGIALNERLPSRTRERLERALDQLQEDGIIQSWQYEKWDEGITEFKGWARIWLESGIIIEPPEAIST